MEAGDDHVIGVEAVGRGWDSPTSEPTSPGEGDVILSPTRATRAKNFSVTGGVGGGMTFLHKVRSSSSILSFLSSLLLSQSSKCVRWVFRPASKSETV